MFSVDVRLSQPLKCILGMFLFYRSKGVNNDCPQEEKLKNNLWLGKRVHRVVGEEEGKVFQDDKKSRRNLKERGATLSERDCCFQVEDPVRYNPCQDEEDARGE